jgi:hypothetical protein
MKTNSSAQLVLRKRLLMVDPSSRFLNRLTSQLPEVLAAKWEIVTCQTFEQAVEVVDMYRLDVLAVTASTKRPEALEFLEKINHRLAHVRTAVLLPKLDDGTERTYLLTGVDACLHRPRTPGNFEAFFAILQRLSEPPADSFRGLLPKVSLSDLIQLECINSRSAIIDIAAGERTGKIYLRGGRVLHATAGSKNGMEAFIRLMEIPGGEFFLKPFSEPPAETINMSRDQLLLEAAFAIDENAGKEVAVQTDVQTEWIIKRPEPVVAPESSAPPPVAKSIPAEAIPAQAAADKVKKTTPVEKPEEADKTEKVAKVEKPAEQVTEVAPVGSADGAAAKPGDAKPAGPRVWDSMSKWLLGIHEEKT